MPSGIPRVARAPRVAAISLPASQRSRRAGTGTHVGRPAWALPRSQQGRDVESRERHCPPPSRRARDALTAVHTWAAPAAAGERRPASPRSRRAGSGTHMGRPVRASAGRSRGETSRRAKHFGYDLSYSAYYLAYFLLYSASVLSYSAYFPPNYLTYFAYGFTYLPFSSLHILHILWHVLHTLFHFQHLFCHILHISFHILHI